MSNIKKIVTLDVMREFNEKKTKNIFVSDNTTIVQGAFKVEGESTTLNTQSVTVKDNIIVTNGDGEALVGSSGFAIKTGKKDAEGNNTEAYGIMYDPNPVIDGVRIGLGNIDANGKFNYQENQAQFLATRADNMSDGSIPSWNNNTKQFVDSELNLQKSIGDRSISTRPRINDQEEEMASYAYQKDSIALAYKSQAGRTETEFNNYFWDADKQVSLHGGHGLNVANIITDNWGDTYEESFGIAFAEGLETRALGKNSHAQNRGTIASANDSSASGVESVASGENGSNANGFKTHAVGASSFTANDQTVASGSAASAFGIGGAAVGTASFKTGKDNQSNGAYSFTEGEGNYAETYCAYAGGHNSHATTNHSFARGEGLRTVAHNQTVFGKYNIDNSNKYDKTLPVLTVGYGTSDTDRKDVFNVLRDGSIIGGRATESTDNDLTLITKGYVDQLIERVKILEQQVTELQAQLDFEELLINGGSTAGVEAADAIQLAILDNTILL